QEQLFFDGHRLNAVCPVPQEFAGLKPWFESHPGFFSNIISPRLPRSVLTRLAVPAGSKMIFTLLATVQTGPHIFTFSRTDFESGDSYSETFFTLIPIQSVLVLIPDFLPLCLYLVFHALLRTPAEPALRLNQGFSAQAFRPIQLPEWLSSSSRSL